MRMKEIWKGAFMKQIEPWFYEKFRCIAHLCEDTCCAGWEIYIDEESLVRYGCDKSKFGLYRQSKIVETEEGATFSLVENERCPFLNEKNLCTMILEDGEDSLCTICGEHPRFFQDYEGFEERGIGLSCPEGSRLLLSAPLVFRENDVADELAADPTGETLYELRTLLMEILTDREIPLRERCLEALELAREGQNQLYGEEFTGGEKVPLKAVLWEKLMGYMIKLEPINEDWQKYMEMLSAKLPILLEKDEEFCQSEGYDENQYGDIGAYILFRHFPDALWDGEIVARLLFALGSTLFVHLCYLSAWVDKGTLTLEDKVYHLKNWSKQVEYNDENTQAFLEDCKWTKDEW